MTLDRKNDTRWRIPARMSHKYIAEINFDEQVVHVYDADYKQL